MKTQTPMQSVTRKTNLPDQEDFAWIDAMLASDAYSKSKARCFRQLLEALIFEGILHPESERVEQEAGEGEGEGEREKGNSLIFRIRGEDAEGGEVIYLCRGRSRPGFGRIRLSEDPILRICGGKAEAAGSLSQFMLETKIDHQAPDDLLSQFIGEIEQTLLKDAQARYWRESRPWPLCGAPYDELESSLLDGHPYHPGFKSRIGFDLRDNRAFGPEFGPRVRPIWLALHQSCAGATAAAGVDTAAFIKEELGESFHSRGLAILRNKGRDPGEYLWIPVHPWQWREIISLHLSEEIRQGRLVVLGEAPEEYRPQQSIRTMANAGSPLKAGLKLSLSMVNTSTSRILAPHTVRNASRISDWLADIVRTDPFLSGECRPILLREIIGVAYDGGRHGIEPLQARTYGVLSCIWRESVHTHLEKGEMAAPWSLLNHLAPDGSPCIDPWVRRMGLEEWLTRLLQVSVMPILHFLVAHGIALESHSQNMLLIHRDGNPTRVALKDFHDGIRFSPGLLADPARMPELAVTPSHHVRVNRNSFLTTEDPAAVRDFVLDAFLFINLAGIAIFLEDHYGLREDRFWTLVNSELSAYQRRFPGLESRFSLFNPRASVLMVEKLANRRLFPESDRQIHPVANPLAAHPLAVK